MDNDGKLAELKEELDDTLTGELGEYKRAEALQQEVDLLKATIKSLHGNLQHHSIINGPLQCTINALKSELDDYRIKYANMQYDLGNKNQELQHLRKEARNLRKREQGRSHIE
jgi:chromosome segregation ATPase